MFRLILKNLWARRRRNAWLFAELVLVTVISWVIFDPTIVMSYVFNQPMGYDTDRLCQVLLSLYPKGSSQYTAEGDSTVRDDFLRLLSLTEKLPNVEAAAPLIGFAYPGSEGNINSGYVSAVDTTKKGSVAMMLFMPGHNYLKAFGIRAADGYDTNELDKMSLGGDEMIITENTAKMYFGDNRSRMRFLKTSRGGIDSTTFIEVKGVVKDIKMYSYRRFTPIAFKIYDDQEDGKDPDKIKILVRVKEGVSLKQYMEDFREKEMARLRSGNLYVRSIVSYPELIRQRERRITDASVMMRRCLTIFFLMNLCLGVIGTFWLQTKIRKEDVGVMLSYGATPAKIVKMLMGEGAVLTTVAVILGCLIYLQYALSEGLYKDYWVATDLCWIESFPQHFMIVSAAVYIAMLTVVLIGIFIPARRISRIRPTEALRDE